MIKTILNGLVFAGLLLPAGVFAQKLIIDFKAIADQTEQISSIQSLSFANDDLIVNFKSGEIQQSSIDDIQKLYFGDVSANKSVKNNTLSVYPNPSSTGITIQGLQAGEHIVNIFQANGRKVIGQKVGSAASLIDISTLPAGMYFIVTNGFNAKFIKL